MSEARKAIDHVVKVLNDGGNESRLLWYVLTALRGPDNDDDSVKHRSTTHLRGAIGLKHCDGFVYALVSYGKPRRFSHADEGSRTSTHVQYHFRNHFNAAVEALEELNYIERDAANLSEPDTK